MKKNISSLDTLWLGADKILRKLKGKDRKKVTSLTKPTSIDEIKKEKIQDGSEKLEEQD